MVDIANLIIIGITIAVSGFIVKYFKKMGKSVNRIRNFTRIELKHVKKGEIIGFHSDEYNNILEIKPQRFTMDNLDKIFDIYQSYDVEDKISGIENYRLYKTWLRYGKLCFDIEGTYVHTIFTPNILYLLFNRKGNHQKVMDALLQFFEFKGKKNGK